MKRIKIAQIGINRYSHAPDIFITLKVLPEIFEIAGYALVEDEQETCADKLSVFEGYKELTVEEILNDPTIEAVAIETDEIHLVKYALMAAKAGKHIHMEKPGSQNLLGFEELILAMKASGKVFHVGYMYRYNPVIAKTIEKAKAGFYGEIFSVEAQMSRLDGRDVKEWLGSFRGGMMFYLGCHLVDLVLQIQGLPEEIIPLNCSTDPDGVGTEDYAFAVLRYKNGISFVKTCASEVAGGERRQLVVNGSKGSMEIKPIEMGSPREEDKYFAMKTRAFESLKDAASAESISEPFDRYIGMMKAFGQYVRGEKENPYTIDYELELFKAILKCCGI